MTHHYPHAPGLKSRADSALLRIEHIVAQRHVPAEVRLVQVAKIMAEEPVLECESVAAITARADALVHEYGPPQTRVADTDFSRVYGAGREGIRTAFAVMDEVQRMQADEDG